MKIINIHTPKAVTELKRILNRATNTLPPEDWPDWLRLASDAIERGEPIVIGVSVDVHKHSAYSLEEITYRKDNHGN